MNRIIGTGLLCAGLAIAGAADAHGPRRNVEVTVTNLSNALYFTPLMIATHPGNVDLFDLGHSASAAVQAMAEGGDTSGLVTQIEGAGGAAADVLPGGLVGPGHSATATYRLHGHGHGHGSGNRYLSLAAMILPTNDAFIGLDSYRVPNRRGVYVIDLFGYDAGTEANDELITGGGAPGAPGIPADPGGNAGTGGSGVTGPDHNDTVHVHRGIVGDDDPLGGASDLDEAVHRWLNPVARVRIVVR